MSTAIAASDIRPGLNSPSAVRRVIIFGYYDGATDGIIEFGPPGEVFLFRQIDEVHNPDGLDARMFALQPLPADALDRIAAVISPHIEPRWPAWFPIWNFPDEATEEQVDAKVDAILADAGSDCWRIETDAYFDFDHFVATSVIPETASQG